MPYAPYLLLLTIKDSKGDTIHNADIVVTTSVGTKEGLLSNEDGLLIYDLSDIGYEAGETATIRISSYYNNEYVLHSFAVSGSYYENTITLSVRELAEGNPTGYPARTILYGIGNEPITRLNPLDVSEDSPKDIRYDANDALPNYIGLNYNSPDADTSSKDWTIFKYTYSGSDATRIQIRKNVAWDDRSGLF